MLNLNYLSYQILQVFLLVTYQMFRHRLNFLLDAFFENPPYLKMNEKVRFLEVFYLKFIILIKICLNICKQLKQFNIKGHCHETSPTAMFCFLCLVIQPTFLCWLIPSIINTYLFFISCLLLCCFKINQY